jgi:hypothetical protein
MTAPIMHRPLRRAGRKPTKPPKEAFDLARDLAADGWSKVGIAHRMGVDPKTFNHWMEREPALQVAVDQGREMERHSLHNMLYRKAMEKGDTTAAAIILNARHGYRTDQSETAGRANITINLPGALSLQQFTALSNKEQSND